MNFVEIIKQLVSTTGIASISWEQLTMIGVSLLLIWLAVKKGFEPLLLIPIGFGGILSNIPVADIAGPSGLLGLVYSFGIESGIFPLLIFMGIGAMTDFGPLIANPKTLLLGVPLPNWESLPP